MKEATYLALLRWQANPADPSAFWQVIYSLFIPGTRMPKAKKEDN